MKKMLLFYSIVFMGISHAQLFESSRYSGIGIPFFEAEVFRTFSPDMQKARINVYFEILYDDMTFVKSDTGAGFVSSFEIVTAVYDEDDNQITAASSSEKVYIEDYDLTNSRREKVYLEHTFGLEPGDYELKMQMHDLVSKKHTNRKISLKVNRYAGKDIDFSDLLFLNEVEMDSSGRIINLQPRIRSNLTRKSDTFYIYFDVYTGSVPKDIQLDFILETPKQKVELDSLIELRLEEAISSHVVSVSKQDLGQNRYKCIIRSQAGDEDERAVSTKSLSFFWTGIPETQDDISLALRQMRYILPSDTLDKYEDVSIEQQKTFFKRYWDNHDPNPATAINELMEEYFGRVNYANREYSNFSEGGWLSDRGRILIKFGFPDDIERHPFEINSIPYVIWRYYTLRKIFVFADQTGFGDYRLLPEYMSQEFQP